MTFSNERDVRKEMNLHNFEEVASEQIQTSLDQAHEEILASTSLTDQSTVTKDIQCAEALLAVSHLFRAVVISQAIDARDWRTSGLRIDESTRLKNLSKLSEQLWEEAWTILHPYLRNGSPTPLIVSQGEEK